MPVAPFKAGITNKSKKIVFDDECQIATASLQNNKSQKTKKRGGENQKPDEIAVKKPQKIKFTDDGDVVVQTEKATSKTFEDEDDYFIKKEQQQLNLRQKLKDTNDEGQKKWYNVYTEYSCSGEVLDIKESEQMELYNLCKNAFDEQKPTYNKRNPSDARWLHTALHKGTAKDRANAGALLVSSNPLGNLEALSTLIGFCKLSNKANVEVVSIMTDLWKQVLLPPLRKLYSLQMRANDWKQLRKDSTISKEKQSRIYAYWYFENELKDNYFEFLKNIMQCLQTGQENNKNCAIVAAAELLAYGPEKEQMLLTMLINKLGDPISKIASKALHHLTEVAHQHPNMCGVIITETEKLLFRNNISDRAQHFSLCFLASIAPSGRPEVCTKLVNICFSLFKVLVQKGAVNNRIMHAILRCLQKAILDAKPAEGSTELLNKEMQDTIYRLVHLADIRVSVQTLGLLLQLITVKSEKSDRFYNALYVKLLDLNLINIGTKTAAQLLHIVHRAIHIDKQAARPQAFIKRLLQLALYTPPQVSAGCLIVLHKLLRTRPELVGANHEDNNIEGLEEHMVRLVDPLDLAKFDSDGEEKYEDVADPSVEKPEALKITMGEKKKPMTSSWDHTKLNNDQEQTKITCIEATKYDPYHRVPSYAGAEFTLRNELHLLRQHFHPTLQVFAENIITRKRIDYYGDPLRDFGLPHFLERFAFKNPKKLEKEKHEKTTMTHKRYVSQGARGMSVKSLTKANCTEDEMYIFNFLEHKREQVALFDKSTKQSQKPGGLEGVDDAVASPDSEGLMTGEVDDNEFEAYLDNYFGKMAKSAKVKEADDQDDEEDLDFLQELGGELEADNSRKKKKEKQPKVDDDDMSDIDADWGDDVDNVEGNFEREGSYLSDDEKGSVDLNEDDNDDFSLEDDDDATSDGDSVGTDADSDSEGDSLKAIKRGKKVSKISSLDNRRFSQKLNQSDDLTSLFAAADDFADLLEESGKTKGQGTISAIHNKDKSSDKQLKWEEKRRSDRKTYMKSKKTFGKTKQGGPNNAKKRKY